MITGCALKTPGPTASVTQGTDCCCGLRLSPQFRESRCGRSLYESVSAHAWVDIVDIGVVLALELEIWHKINQPVPACPWMAMKQMALSHTQVTTPQER